MNEIVLIALKRPYTFVVLAILILFFGIQSIFKAPTDVFPNIKIPVISVVWGYQGMLPEDVAGRITYFFERALTSTVEGIKSINSRSYYGSSIINIELQPHTDLAGAEAEVAAISQTVVTSLPPDISPPMIMRLEASSVPVAMLQVTSEKMTPAELYNLAFMRIRSLLVTIPGAIIPQPYGGTPMQLLVSLDKQKLLSRNLSPMDVFKAFNEQSAVLPAGDQKIGKTDWMVMTNAIPIQVEDFNNIPIKRVGNSTFFMRDVANVALGGPPQLNSVLVDGKQSVLIVVMKSGDASTLDVVDGIRKTMPRIKEISPDDVEIKLLNDASVFVKDSIENVVHEMILAAALTGLVVLLFLGSWRATTIIATSIPLSLLSSIIGLHLIGESINVMTLGGLALAVGILVDDATVMIENIDTHIEMGKPLEKAIIDAANEIVIPTFVATLAIVIVWFPLFQLSGVSGWLFKPMAEAVALAMIASFILSRTLVPTMAKYLLTAHHSPETHNHGSHSKGAAKHHITPTVPKKSNSRFAFIKEWIDFLIRFQKGFERNFTEFRERYYILLQKVIADRKRFVKIFLAIATGSLLLFYLNGRDFFPEIKAGTLQMHMRAPLGTRIEVSGRIATLVSEDIKKLLPGKVESVLSNCGLPVGPHNLAFIPTPTIGSQDCDLTISLKDEESPVWDYRQTLRKGLSELYPGTIFTFQPADLTAKILNFGSPSPIDIQINGMDLEKNFEFAQKLQGKLKTIPGAADVVIQQTMSTPTLLVDGNRSLGINLDLPMKSVAENMLLATSGSQQIDQEYWMDRKTGLSYQINIYVPQPQMRRTEDLLTVPVNRGDLQENSENGIQLLGNVANITPTGTPGLVTHQNLLPLIDVYVSAEGRDLGGVLSDAQKIMDSMKSELPRGAAIEILGQAETMRSAYIELIGGLFVAILLVYLLIVVNFQSWTDPFIIITALPGALAGIAWSLFLTRTYISVPALTGAIMCMGTATANSILVVSYARDRLEVHGDAIRAAIEAGYSRIRPVLMTASAMIIGMVPMSISNSQNAPLGRAVIGGLAVATFATLFFVPCIYAIIYNNRAKIQKESSK
ncbi:efflux RND transporter permease subunit [Leptospira selangorensis]|uniref:Efflux RND transporter permease subunit n=1 Tax=Leptospira selangorensis TaxID=2484982 RepID=A0A5F2C256_9LEPT|nr:efflux RND transporter permease subunit [Leptospira selangorensis]TGM13006.1 efflux RND transporter permease subunit [Leptospira selangorensis]TGM21242.1 efflux RND transporter permease subunit [Leptospira selangorensis]